MKVKYYTKNFNSEKVSKKMSSQSLSLLDLRGLYKTTLAEYQESSLALEKLGEEESEKRDDLEARITVCRFRLIALQGKIDEQTLSSLPHLKNKLNGYSRGWTKFSKLEPGQIPHEIRVKGYLGEKAELEEGLMELDTEIDLLGVELNPVVNPVERQKLKSKILELRSRKITLAKQLNQIRIKIQTVHEQLDGFKPASLDHVIEINESLAEERSRRYLRLESDKDTCKRDLLKLMGQKELRAIDVSNLQDEIDEINIECGKKIPRREKMKLIERQQQLLARKDQILDELEGINSQVRDVEQRYVMIKEALREFSSEMVLM